MNMLIKHAEKTCSGRQGECKFRNCLDTLLVIWSWPISAVQSKCHDSLQHWWSNVKWYAMWCCLYLFALSHLMCYWVFLQVFCSPWGCVQSPILKWDQQDCRCCLKGKCMYCIKL